MIRRIALASLAVVVLTFYLPFAALAYLASGGGQLRLPTPATVAATAALALATATASIALAYPAAYYLAKRGTALEFALLVAPLWVGTLIKAYSLQVLYSAARAAAGLELYGTPQGVLIGMVYEYLPYAVVTIYAAVEKLEEAPVNAARVLGASRLQAFLRVELPLTMPGVTAAFLLIFLMAMGEVVMPAVLGAGKVYTLGSYIYDLYFRSRDFYSGSLLSFALSGLSLLATFLVVRTVRRISL